MGIAIPQIITEDRASGAQVIEGSLRFDRDPNPNGGPMYLTRTLGSGNTKTFTLAYWFKYDSEQNGIRYISTGYSVGGNSYGFYIGDNSNSITFNDSGTNSAGYNVRPSSKQRDFGWYHFVFNLDTTESNEDDRVRIYVNGVQETVFGTNTRPDEDATGNMNSNGLELSIGAWNYPAGGGYSDGLEGQLSQFYHIDGQALDPSYFGFTDPLTGTWRPKKFRIDDAPTTDWGTNGFYLPFDGSDLIGKDQSGKGNDFTPKFGGSVIPSKATGALPTLNTLYGGTVAIPQARGNAGIAVTVAGKTGGGNAYYLDGVEAKTLSLVRGQTVTFDTSDSTVGGHPFRFSGVSNGAHAADYRSVLFDGTGDYLLSASSTDYAFGTGDFTFEFWVYIESYPSGDLYAIASFTDDKNNIDIDGDGHLTYYDGTSYDTGAVVPLNEWTHVAYSKSGTAVRIFLNGTNIYTVTSSVDVGSSARQFYIGVRYDGSQNTLNGYLSDYRVVKGTAVYTENFTPPTTSLTSITNTKLLCCNNSSVTGTTTGTVTSSGDPTSSTTNPYDTYPFATVTSISEGSVGAATTITIPHNAPDDLYYYCTAHSGMGGNLPIRTDLQVADTYAWKNVLAASGVNVNDSSNLVNCTNSAKALTFSGASVQSELAVFYGHSYKFDGSNDKISGSFATGSIGQSDFTLEYWANSQTLSDWQTHFSITRGSNGFNTGTDGSGDFVWFDQAGSSSRKIEVTNAINTHRWHHWAFVRSATTVTGYLDGRAVATFTSPYDYSQTAFNIGCLDGSAEYFNGFMADVRVYVGVAKYTSDFIPASTNPDVQLDSPSGVSYSSELTKPTNGSVSFDGTGDYLSIPVNNSDFDWAADGSLTIEAFVNMNAITGQTYNSIINRWGGSGTYSFGLDVKNNGNLFFYRGNGSSITTHESSGITIGLNQWYHIAVVKDGTTGRFFINGQTCGTFSWNEAFTNSTSIPLHLGNLSDGNSYPIDGRISNARIVNGTAVYRSTFEPPLEPLTNITNTKLLCCLSDSSATTAAVTPGTITANGDATANAFNPFDRDVDFARGKASEYCVLNPLDQKDGTITLAGLGYTSTGASNVSGKLAMPRNSGKYYYETTLKRGTGGVIGIGGLSCSNITNLSDMNKIYGYSPNGSKYENDTQTSYGQTWAVGDTISTLFDTDSNELTFYKNGMTQGLAFRVANGYDYFPQVHTNNVSILLNFGQNPFRFQPPSGYKPINTANLPSPGLTRPDKSAACALWSGNGTTRQINVGFQPDLVWGYCRNQSGACYWADSVRGRNVMIYSTSDANETTNNQVMDSKYFNPDGFVVGTDTTINNSGDTYMGWAFKAGGKDGTWNIDGHAYASAADANMSVGALNSSTMNQDQTWSGLFTLASGSFDQAITNAFDGHISRANQARTSGNAVLITMTLSTPVVVASEIKVFGERNYGSVCTVTVAGTTHTSTIADSAAPAAHHTFKVSGSLTQMTLTSLDPPGTGRTYMEGMMIDNKLLVDNGVSINKPSIAPTKASVGTQSGLSIIKYEGNGSATQTLPHGLGKTPTQIIIKRLDGGSGNTGDWMMGGVGLHSWSYYLVPNKNQAEASDFAPFGPEPTDSVFTVGSSDRVNNDGNDYIAYVWTDIPGVQKFGRYIGNGNADGAFINTGFRPAMLIVKVITSGQSERWYMFDNKRDTYNPTYKYKDWGAQMAEQTGYSANLVDFVSNGFKFRNGAGNFWNGAYNYVYMAWAESPQFNLYGGQSNAR